MILSPRDLLTKLQAAQDQLDAYVKAYISIREHAETCATINHLLAWAKRGPDQLDAGLMEQLDAELKKLRPLREVLRAVFVPAFEGGLDLSDPIARHDEKLQAAKQACGIVRNPSQDADVTAATDTIFRSFDELSEHVQGISADCKTQAAELLVSIRSKVTTIFEIDTYRRMEERSPQVDVRPKPIGDSAPASTRFTSPNERTQTPVAVTGTSNRRSEEAGSWEGGK